MKVVKVEILPAKDGDVVTAVIVEESKKGGNWKEGSREVVFSGTPAASRSILLDDDERVIIEGKVEAKVVYDPVQMMTAYEPVSEDAKERKQKHEEEQKKRYEEFKKLDEKEEEETEEQKERKRQIKAHNEPPVDSKVVKEEHSGTRSAPRGR